MRQYLCDMSALEEAKPTVMRAGGTPVVVVRLAEEVFALQARCPHWDAPLINATISVSRREIICPWHRFRYSLDNGSCVASNNRPALQNYDVHREGTSIFAEIPE